MHATNIAQSQLAEAAERARAAGLADRVSFAFADYHDFGGPAGRYDCWWCQEALLYAADRGRVFSEARRVVKAGGRVVFTDLTLSRALPSDERQLFMADIRAPHLWDIEDYDRLFARMGFVVCERQDWSPHVASTFAAVARNLAAVRAGFAARIGEEAVRGTEYRIARQLDMARAGHLGWCFYTLAGLSPHAHHRHRNDPARLRHALPADLCAGRIPDARGAAGQGAYERPVDHRLGRGGHVGRARIR